MDTNLDHILIFKTNIKTQEDKNKVRGGLETLGNVARWSVDLEDVDSVLRVESDVLRPHHIITVINNHGFDCAELE